MKRIYPTRATISIGLIFSCMFIFFAFTSKEGVYHSRGVSPADSLASGNLILPEDLQNLSGRELYIQACSNCHGIDGKGASVNQLGLQTPPPDFTDCDFANREPDGDWVAVAHQGGPVRGFSNEMPAFGEALTIEQLQRVMNHVRSFCKNSDWPRGELNLPRPLVTEKAYPEDEVVISSFIDVENEGAVSNEFVYEHRFGSRNQLEIVIPFGYSQQPNGSWIGGNLGDVALGVKRALFHNVNSGTIFSLTGEVLIPTGDEQRGFGKGTTVFEPFISFGQMMPANSFLQVQSGLEIPYIDGKAENEAFWRAALGSSLNPNPWGRTWSPMVEVLGSREMEAGAATHWDLVPQMQITLNKRQHVMLNIGYRIPVDDSGRDSQVMVYILWDWFDGSFMEGW